MTERIPLSSAGWDFPDPPDCKILKLPQSEAEPADTGTPEEGPVADSLPASDDQEFLAKLAAAQGGCTETLGEILASLHAYLFMIAGQYWRQSPGSQQNPSDIVQMAHLDAIRHFHQFRGNSRKELLGWVKRILLSNVQDEWRRAHARRVAPGRDLSAWGGLIQFQTGPELFDSSPSAEVIRDERIEMIRRILSQLPERYREVIVLYHFEGLGMKEIAGRWHCSEDAVSKVWGRALQYLGRQVKRFL